jgi:hypothetical protein
MRARFVLTIFGLMLRRGNEPFTRKRLGRAP